MTTTLQFSSDTWTVGAPRLLAGLDRYGALDLGTHIATHGPLPSADRPRLVALLDAIGLTGRGGAGFPFAAKVRATPDGATVIVNGSESEPASRKDRTLLTRAPHLVLDGAVAVAAAVRARRVTVAVHDASAAAAVQRAIAERAEIGYVRVERTFGSFVAGEAQALHRGLRGGPARPPGRRMYLTQQGTLLSNVETFAQVAVALRLGAHRFRETGPLAEPGTALLTLSGAVARAGVVEVPIGTPLGIVLEAAGATHPRAVVLGGYHGAWRLPRPEVPLAPNTGLGAGIVAVLNERTCALGELARVTAWMAAQSAGQCGPCRFGLPTLARDVASVLHGGDPALALHHARLVDGRGACHQPDGTARFVTSGLALLGEEIERHRSGGCGRPVLGQLAVPA